MNNKMITNTLITVLLGLIISTIIYSYTLGNIEKSNQLELRQLFKMEKSLIQNELDLNLEILYSLKNFFLSSSYVSREEFKTFTQSTVKRHKSIQALEWIPKVTQNLRSKYEKEATKSLNLKYMIKSKDSSGQMIREKIKDEYFPVYYVEPLLGNLKALGFDLSSSPTRLKSLNNAKISKKITATKRIKLLQETGTQFGFLVFLPVWKTEKEVELKGFVLGVYRVGDMVETALSRIQKENSLLDMWLIDSTEQTHSSVTDENNILYTNTKLNTIKTDVYHENIFIEGRVWTLHAKPSAQYIAKHKNSLPIIAFTISFIIILLVGYIITLKSLKAKELETLVDEKTKDLIHYNEKFETLLARFDEKVIASSTDARGTIKYVTKAFCKISGFSKEELIGKNHNIVRHPDMDKEFYTTLWKTIKSGKIFNGEVKNKRKDGSFYWVDVMISPEYDKDQKIVGFFAIREDITAKKEIEQFNLTLENKIHQAVEENQQKDRLLLEQSKLAAMGEMVGAIAHQWRQPLNALAMRIQFIEDDFEDELIDEKYVKEYSIEGMKLVNFMSKTIDDFRNFFTIDKIKSNFDIRTKIDETINMLSGQFENHKIKIEINDNNFEVMGYSSEFQQVVLNILNNAKDAFIEKNMEEGKIKIDILLKDQTGYITIQDNAGGIPQNVIKRIFEPYYTTKEQGKGTGLGLYMSKMIIEDNMNGRIGVENIENGAVFTIEIGISNG